MTPPAPAPVHDTFQARSDGSHGRTWVIHPFLFAAFPVVFLYSQNLQQFSANVTLLPGAALLLCTCVLWGLLWLLLRNRVKAGLVTSLFVLLFFCYGPAWRVLPYFRFMLWGIRIERTKVVLLAWTGLLLTGIWFTQRTRRDLRQMTRVINVTAAVLVGISAVQITWHHLTRPGSGSLRRHREETGNPPASLKTPGQKPDIYYIVLDTYGREDILRELYQEDISGFLDQLRQRGFYVADESTSNYASTTLSLASAMNMAYLSELLPEVDVNLTDQAPLSDLIRHSELVRFLKQHGYTTVAFVSGCDVADMLSADVFLKSGWFSDEFANALVDVTPLPVVERRLNQAHQHRARIHFILDKLRSLPRRESPKFVLAHLMIPHFPFVFARNGEPVDPVRLNKLAPGWIGEDLRDQYRKFYADQVAWINTELVKVLDSLLSESSSPPVVILQGDHGPRSLLKPAQNSREALRERFGILNAYYLPGKDDAQLYPGISPVNSFRVVLNSYFHTNYPLLADRCVFSILEQPYRLTDVTGVVRNDVPRDRRPPE